jgi:hypothetical protein
VSRGTKKRRNALVALGEIGVGKHDKEAGLVRVGDPHLRAVDHPVVAGVLGRRGERKGVGAGTGLGETERADRVARQPRQPLALLRVRCPLAQSGDNKRILHIAAHADTGVDTRQLLNGQHGRHERRAAAAVLGLELNRHEAVGKHAVNDAAVHRHGAVHLGDARLHVLDGELAHQVAQRNLFVAQRV